MMFDYKMKEDLCKGPYFDEAIKVVRPGLRLRRVGKGCANETFYPID